MKKLFLSTILLGLSLLSYSQQDLNSLLSTYSQNIKSCNTPYAKSCIYDTNYMRTSVYGNKLTIEYGFSFDSQRNDYIAHIRAVVDLSTALIYTGWWSNMHNGWQNGGDKSILTIEDKNGIDYYFTGAQDYNLGTKQNIVEYLCFSFGTEPLANRALAEFLKVQNGKRLEPEPWNRPKVVKTPKPQEQPMTTTTKQYRGTTKAKTTTKTSTKVSTSKPKSQSSKSGKYVQ